MFFNMMFYAIMLHSNLSSQELCAGTVPPHLLSALHGQDLRKRCVQLRAAACSVLGGEVIVVSK